MKYAAYGLLAALLALGVYGAIPTTAEGWYTPSGGFSRQSGTGVLVWNDDEGNEHFTDLSVDEWGRVSGVPDFLGDAALETAYNALVKAAHNEAYNAVQDEAIETVGRNLYELTSKSGIHIVNRDTGRDYTIRFDGSIASSVSSPGDVEAVSDEDDLADGASLGWNEGGSIEVKGWSSQDASRSFDVASSSSASSSGVLEFPVRTGKGEPMAYASWRGVDWLSLGFNPDSRKLELHGWRDEPNDNMTSLADALSTPDAAKGLFEDYDVVVRNGNYGLKYVALGELNLDGAPPDGSSVTTNSANGAEVDGVLSVRGWSDAQSSASAGNPQLPLAKGGTSLEWQPLSDFLNENIFGLTVDGKVNLKGVSADADNVRVMTVRSNGGEPELASSGLSDLVETPLAVDQATKRLAISGWSGATPAATPLSDLLVNNSGYVFDPARSPSLLSRTVSGSLAYMPVGALAVPAPDGRSIVTNGWGLAVNGYDEAQAGMVAHKTGNGLEWKLPSVFAVDEATLTTNVYNGAGADGVASLHGWSSANLLASPGCRVVPYADGSSSLNWSEFGDFFSPRVFETGADGKVILKGLSAGEDEIRVMTVAATDAGAALTSTSLPTLLAPTLETDADGKIAISGWSGATPAATPLSDAILSNSGYVFDPAQSVSLLSRKADGTLAYMPLGFLNVAPDELSVTTNAYGFALKGYDDAPADAAPFKSADGLEWRKVAAAVDGASVTTNSADGAVSDEAVSLYGWSQATAESIPVKGESALEWKTPGELVDGVSLAWTRKANAAGSVFEVKGASVYGGRHAKHYFGTSVDEGAIVGWHELPNTTTNRVEGDNLTIASTVDEYDPDLKRLGLRGWNPNAQLGEPFLLANNGGVLDYFSLSSLTNLAACACSNKWENVLDWIGDGELSPYGGLSFSDSTLDRYLCGTLGYIYSTSPDDLHFNNDGDGIEASFAAPSNWADDDSIGLNADGEYQIAGWENAFSCSADVSDMLSNPASSDATTHLFLAKNTNSGELHYVPVGDGVKSGAEVDDETITTNTYHGATVSGVASIYGWSTAQNGSFLSKNDSGNLEWRKMATDTDGLSVTTNASAALTIAGFDDAEAGAVPVKAENGLSWLKSSSATNIILAGAGINITDNGGGAITISSAVAQSGSSGGGSSGGGAQISLTVVTAVRYDMETHKFQVKTRQCRFYGSADEESGWTDVFETVSHASEHANE